MQTQRAHARLSRADLLSTGASPGAMWLVAAAAFGAVAEGAQADPLSDNDLAFARLLTGVELLAVDFYERALKASRFRAVGNKYLGNTLSNEQEHYGSVSAILTGAGSTPAAAADFVFTYPACAVGSRLSIARLGRELETIFLGSYLGAGAAGAGPFLRQPPCPGAGTRAHSPS